MVPNGVYEMVVYESSFKPVFHLLCLTSELTLTMQESIRQGDPKSATNAPFPQCPIMSGFLAHLDY